MRNPLPASHSWEDYADWFLGLTEGASDDTKARCGFVYGDLRSRLHFRPVGGAGMSMQGPGGAGGRDPGAQRWGAEKQQIDKQAQEEHLVHEAQRIHAEEAAERGEAKPKRPWWKFWA